MKHLFSEYGLLVIYIVAFAFAFAMWNMFTDESTGYKRSMNSIIASISGSSGAEVQAAENEIKARGWTYIE